MAGAQQDAGCAPRHLCPRAARSAKRGASVRVTTALARGGGVARALRRGAPLRELKFRRGALAAGQHDGDGGGEEVEMVSRTFSRAVRAGRGQVRADRCVHKAAPVWKVCEEGRGEGP